MEKIKVILTYEIDPETGNSTLINKEVVEINSFDNFPVLYLEKNKIKFNQKAIELMGLAYGDLIDIRFDNDTPIIGTNINFGIESGNKFTKSNTVSCKGSINDSLSKLGNIFYLKKYDNNVNLFIMATSLEESEKEILPIKQIDNEEEEVLNLEGIEFPDNTPEVDQKENNDILLELESMFDNDDNETTVNKSIFKL